MNRFFNSQNEESKARLLARACQQNNEQIWDLLCQKYEPINNQDSHGNTILHYACKEGYTQVVKKLTAQYGSWALGASLRNIARETPLDCARQNGHLDLLNLPELSSV